MKANPAGAGFAMYRSDCLYRVPAREGQTGILQEEFLQCTPVNGRQRFDVGDEDVFVDLVDAFRHGTEFDDLRTDTGDETAVGCATGCGEFRRQTGFGCDRFGKCVAQGATWRQERYTGIVPV